MTIFFSEIIGVNIAQNVFVSHETVDGKDVYHFCGISLVGNEYSPNPIGLGRYYALNSELGIGVKANEISLVQNGREIVTIPGDFTRYAQKPPEWVFWEGITEGPRLFVLANDSQHCWIKIKRHLQEQSLSNATAKQVLMEITRWEIRSAHMLRVVWEILSREFPHYPCQKAVIHIADQQWLVCNRLHDPTLMIMGNGENVWGEIGMQDKQMVGYPKVAPLHNGWAVRFSRRGYFLIRDNCHIRIQPVTFPAGFWHRYESWIFWPVSGDIFLPSQRLVLGTVPEQHEMIGVTRDWAFLVPDPHVSFWGQRQNKNNATIADRRWNIYNVTPNPNRWWDKSFITAINRQGKIHRIDPGQRYGNNLHFTIGNESAFAVWKSPKGYVLSVESVSDQSPLCQQWTALLFPSRGYNINAVGVITGSPDVAVILFTRGRRAVCRVCLISADGEVFLLPRSLHGSWKSGGSIFLEQVSNKMHISLVDVSKKQTRQVATLEILERGHLRVHSDSGVVFDAVMDKVSPKLLWSYLRRGLTQGV